MTSPTSSHAPNPQQSTDQDGFPDAPTATFFGAIAAAFRRYAEFRGRATRSEFWWWVLFTVLASAAIGALPFDHSAASGSPYAAVWGIAVLLPSLSVQVRRLRDAGYGWGHLFWFFLPVAGLVVLVVLSAQPSRPGAQRQDTGRDRYAEVPAR